MAILAHPPETFFSKLRKSWRFNKAIVQTTKFMDCVYVQLTIDHKDFQVNV